jgi:hypothetical protein
MMPIFVKARTSRSRTPAYPFIIAGTRSSRSRSPPPAYGTRYPTKVVSTPVTFRPDGGIFRHSLLAGIPSQPQRKPTKLSWFAKNILRKKQAKRAPQSIGQGWQQLSLK